MSGSLPVTPFPRSPCCPASLKHINRSRPCWLCCLQGRFKRPLLASSAVMGQEFVKAPPAGWDNIRIVVDLVLRAAARGFSNTIKVSNYTRPVI